MRWAPALALAILKLAHAYAEDHDEPHELQAGPSESRAALIRIVINPETRISVSRVGQLPSTTSCGKPLILPVEIVNQGFVTAALEASIVDGASEDISVEFPTQPLTGRDEERRILRVTLRRPGVSDITVAFRARHGFPDLGGRDRIHLLLRCSA
jgi:hypothetical protein